MKLRNCILPLLLTAISVPTPAQHMRTIPNFSKLPGPVVHKILQDEEGYIWYGTTESGLCRDNGYQIDIFVGDRQSGFSRHDRFVREMCLTPDHRLLFATDTGAWLLDKKTYSIERFDTIVTRGHSVQSVVADPDNGSYWLTMGNSVLHFDNNRNLIRKYDIGQGEQQPTAMSTFFDSSNRLWLMLHQGGLQLYNSHNDTFEPCQWDYPCSPVTMTEDTLHHCLWIGTIGGGIVRYQHIVNPRQGTLTSYDVTHGKTQEERGTRGFVFGLCQSGNRLWAAAMDNLYCYIIDNDGQLIEADTRGFIPAKRKVLDSPYLDRAGNVWVPSYTPNPFVIMPSATDISSYRVPQMEQQTGYPLIADLVEQEGDGFWMLQSHVGLMYYRPSDNLLVAEPEGGPTRYAQSLLLRHHNGQGVWLKNGTQLMHAMLQGRTINSKIMAELPDNIHSLYETAEGSLLIGTDNGIYLLRPGNSQPQLLKQGTGAVTDVCQTADGALYFISLHHGFARLTTESKVVSYDRSHHFDHFATDGRQLWLSSPDGVVASFEAGSQLLTIDELATDRRGCVVKHITVDSNGHLWLLTSLYVKEYNPRNHSFRIFNTNDSNIGMDYFQDIKLKGQQVCFGGAGGIFTTTSSMALEDSVRQANPVVADVLIDGQRLHLPFGKREVTVSAGTSQLILYLTTFDHLHAANVMFAYRLGSNKKWVYLPEGINIVQLTNLAKGSYTLELMATNEQGNWSKPQQVFTVHRLPAWWETWWAYLIYTLLFALLLFVAVRWYINRQHQRHLAAMDKQLTDMKIRFFINISHELRTPLTLIITPLTSIVSQMYESEVKRKLEAILGHANELLQQVNNLLSFRKLEMGQMRLQLRYGELNDFVRQEVELFRPVFDKKQVRLNFYPCEGQLNFYFDKNMVHHILFNLLSNAHKFTTQGGSVAVRTARQTDGYLRIEVADTGVGISAEQQKHIFERFYQGDAATESSHPGSGIGLNMVSEMVALHHGNISVDSQPGIGSTFTVCLPWKDKEDKNVTTSSSPAETSSTIRQQRQEASATSTAEDDTNRHFTVLLIDDNDEFRQFVADELRSQYHVLQATDGIEGLTMAQEEQVDVVISDVMMPRMDGFELCQRLKNDEKTQHLTVILLTALAGQESELGGYQCGADYYISKPFDMEILMSRLMSIEKQQKERRQQLLQQIENPDIDTLYKVDQDRVFIKQMMDLISSHLSDPDYKSEQLSSDLCMSYITAYRKIKALTGLSPGEFIRNFRLKHACQLLRSTTFTLNEIADRSGFSSASYLTRSFIKEYGQSPSEYRKQAQE